VPVLMVNAVGGSTSTTRLSARFHRGTSRAAPAQSRATARCCAGGFDARRLALSYQELEADYEAVEQAIGVAGSAGNLDGSLTGEAASSRAAAQPYPMDRCATGWTALTDTPPFARLASVSGTRAINSVPTTATRVHLLRLLHGNICHRDAKGSTDANVIAAEQTGCSHRDGRARDTNRGRR